MALPRKAWRFLKPATQKRKLAHYRKQGLSESQVASRYNAGTLGPQTAARGHSKTPERPQRAYKHPERYQEYLRKRPVSTGSRNPRTPRDRAYDNFHRHLGSYVKYNDERVRQQVYQMMTNEEVDWTITASEEDLLHYATVAMHQRYFNQKLQSPWWYH